MKHREIQSVGAPPVVVTTTCCRHVSECPRSIHSARCDYDGRDIYLRLKYSVATQALTYFCPLRYRMVQEAHLNNEILVLSIQASFTLKGVFSLEMTYKICDEEDISQSIVSNPVYLSSL